MNKIFAKVFLCYFLAINFASAGILGGPEQKIAAGLVQKKPLQLEIQKQFSIDDSAKCLAVVLKISVSQIKGAVQDNQNVNFPWALVYESANYSVNWHLSNGMPKSVYEKLLNSYATQLSQSNASDQKFFNDCKEKYSAIEAVAFKNFNN